MNKEIRIDKVLPGNLRRINNKFFGRKVDSNLIHDIACWLVDYRCYRLDNEEYTTKFIKHNFKYRINRTVAIYNEIINNIYYDGEKINICA